METFNRIVLNVPHSSIERYYEGWNDSANMLPIVKQWTDWHTDILFNPVDIESVKMVRFPFSRFFCDVDRLINDPLEEKGQGIYYTNFLDKFTRNISFRDEAYIEYDVYHSMLYMATDIDNCLIINCHSFPSTLSDVEVCIAYNEDNTKPSEDLVNLIADSFTEIGLKIGINNPYGNTLSPNTDKIGLKSVLIGFNKSTYMDENTLLIDQHKFHKIKTQLSTIYRKLIKP